MTIACCYVVPEGIVLGADSTITTKIGQKLHYLNHNQKIFEVGEEGTGRFGVLTWGLTSFGSLSYRTLIARLSDEFKKSEPPSVLDAANIFGDLVFGAYQASFQEKIESFRKIKTDIEESDEPVTAAEKRRDKIQRDKLDEVYNSLLVGFCIAGYVDRDRIPYAYELIFHPDLRSHAVPNRITKLKHFGNDNVVSRIIGVFDEDIKKAILGSGKWDGDITDLENVLANIRLERPDMTVRDAIDFVHFTIYSTIKATKFSTRDKDCGGPVELAVITTDRRFRWVQHKGWNSAINDWSN